MNRHRFNFAIERVGEIALRYLGKDARFVITAWNPETCETHSWIPENYRKEAVTLMKDGIEALEHPEHIIKPANDAGSTGTSRD